MRLIFLFLLFNSLACFAQDSISIEGLEQKKHIILDKLNSALASSDSQLLYSVANDIENMWQRSPSSLSYQNWQEARDLRLKTHLLALETVYVNNDPSFDANIEAYKLVTPPITYNIMQYATGLGVQQIKDVKFQKQVKRDLERIASARKIRDFKGTLQTITAQWQREILQFAANNYSISANHNTKEIDLNTALQIVKKTLKNNVLNQKVLSWVTKLSYCDYPIIRAEIKSGKNLCRSIVQQHRSQQ